ncbi:DUF4279 domain-containing protein [Candidatus Curtissbacteria bacterium]|nr:DUF4279 domain-containing protein [Candidatus Curtissbacteria bacterium]
MNKDRVTKNEIRAYFSVYPKNIAPEELTKLIGLKPYKTHLKGDPVVQNNLEGPKFKDNFWSIKSQADPSVSLEEHLENLLDQLRPYKNKILQYTGDMYKELAFTIFCNEGRPGVHINKKLLQELTDYGIEIDMDIYFKKS